MISAKRSQRIKNSYPGPDSVTSRGCAKLASRSALLCQPTKVHLLWGIEAATALLEDGDVCIVDGDADLARPRAALPKYCCGHQEGRTLRCIYIYAYKHKAKPSQGTHNIKASVYNIITCSYPADEGGVQSAYRELSSSNTGHFFLCCCLKPC